MFSNVTNAILNSDIIPSVNSTFWSGLGNIFVSVGSWLLQGIATIMYTICRFALNLIDFMQFLVQKLAGIDMWMNLDKLDLNNLKETDVVFRFLLSDTVLDVFRTMFVIFIVLLIVFTIVAILKNEYSNATSGGDKLNDHGKVWFTAAKAILTVVLVPILLIVGILASNAILASLAKAFNINGNMSLGGQIFVASAYDASSYRFYASQGVRKYTSNTVNFEYDGQKYTVNSALTALDPDALKDSKPFTGYMFTYNGEDFYLWQCSAEEKDAYYYYIKGVLGAYIVEDEPSRDADFLDKIANYNQTFEATEKAYNRAGNYYSTLCSEADECNSNGFFTMSLELKKGSSIFIDAAYNTWSYNQILQTNISNWGSQNVTLETSVDTFKTIGGTSREAKIVANSDSWGKLHDGGKYGFAPLSVEYEVMGDVIDFMIENSVTLYYVNASNTNINYNGGGLDNFARYSKEISVDGITKTVLGLLVDYKDEGRVAYQINTGVNSELDGATYIVCYYDNATNQYIPLVNNQYVVDAAGNRYKFSSSQYNSDYKGAVIARAMFKNSSSARNCEPTYIKTTMVVDQKGADFDSKLATAVQLDYVGDYNYTYLSQLTDASAKDTTLGYSYSAGNMFIDDGILTYYMEPETNASGNNENSFTALGVDLTQQVDNTDTPDDPYDTKTVSTKMGDIATEIQNYIMQNITDANDYVYTAVPDSLSVSDSHVISFKFYRNGDTNPQHYTVQLTVKDETLVDIANDEQLCKVDFEISISLQDSEQKPLIEEVPFNESDIAHNYIYTADGGKTVYLYLIEETDPSEVDDETFYGSNGYNTTNVNYVSEEVLEMLYDSESAAQNYQYKNISQRIDADNRTITMSVYKYVDGYGESYANSKKYIVTINFVEVKSVSVGSEPNIENYKLHEFSVDIKEINEKPEIVDYADNIDRSSTTNNGVYNRDGYIHFFNTAESMLSINLLDSAQSIAEGVANLVNTEEDYTASLLEDSVSYTGAVEFGINYVGNLKINFSVKIQENDSDIYYLARFTLDIKAVEKTGDKIDTEPAVDKYEYKFSCNYTIYNAYKAYWDNMDLTNPIQSMAETPEDLIFTIVDLKREDKTASYLVGDKKYQTVIQYTYKQVSENQAITYTFNAVYTGTDCDDGVEFITVSNAGTLDEIGKNADSFDESKLVFKLGTLRTIYMPEYTFIKDNGTTYTYYIVDTNNTTPDTVHYYTVTFNKDATELDITATTSDSGITYEVGAANPIVAYTYDGSASEVNADMLTTAIGYIYEHFQVKTYSIDMHGYEDITSRKVEEGKTRYTVILNSNTGNTIALTSTDIYLDDGSTDYLYSNFNKYLLQAEFDGEIYSRAISADTALNNTIAKLLEQPVSVAFCRDEMSNMHWVFDFKINIWTSGEGFDFLWRGPKMGFATIQNNKDLSHNAVLTLSRGQVKLDYNFSGNIAIGNLYLITDLNWIILIFAIVLIFGILGKAVWGLIGRIYQITLLFIIMPAVASTAPLDSKNSRFESWKSKLISQVLGAYGVTIGLNFFFILIPVIREASAIFTDADLVGMSSSLRFFAGSADRLNYLCYILFLLVSFTLLKTVPSLVQEFTGYKDGEVIKQGEDTKKSVVSTVEEAGKSLSGKGVVDSVNNVGKLAKPFLTPGSGFVDEGKKIYDKIRGKKDGKKKAEEEARDQQNQELSKQNVQNRINEAQRRMNGELSEEEKIEAVRKENEKIAEYNKNRGENEAEKQLFSEDAAGYQAMMEAKETERAAQAESLTEEGVDEVAEEVANKENANGEQYANDAKRYAEASQMYAEAAQESAGIATGDVKDYVGEAEKAEAAAKAQEKAKKREQRKYEKSTEGQLTAAEKLAADGKAKASLRLSKTDVENWNKTHGADEQITDGKGKEQKELRLRAKQEKYLNKLRNQLDDEQNGIKHGVGASVVRKLVGGKKTWQQRVDEAAKLERSRENLNKAYTDKKKLEKDLANIDVSKVNFDGEADRVMEQMMKHPAGKQAVKTYDKYVEQQAKNGRSGLAVRKEALEIMKQESLKIADKNVQKATSANKKAEKNVAETYKGFLYKSGRTAGTFAAVVSAPITQVAKIVAGKGKTFLLGHSENDKNNAKALLAEKANYAKATDKAKKDYETEIANSVKGQYNKFMEKYNKLKTDGGDQSKIYDLLKNNKDLLKGSGFSMKGLEDNITAERKKTITPRVVQNFEQFIKNNGIDGDISKLYAHRQKDIEKEQQQVERKREAYEKAQQEQNNYEQLNRKAIKKAEQMINGSHIRSIGVAGNLHKASQATKDWFVKGGTYVVNGIKNSSVGKAVVKGVKAVAKGAKVTANAVAKGTKAVGKAVYYGTGVGYIVKGVNGVKKWNKERLEIKANARAKTAQNVEASNESRKAINKDVNKIIGQTLYRRKNKADAELVNKLEKRVANLRAKGKALEAVELEKLLTKYKNNVLPKGAEKRLQHYANMNPVTRTRQAKANANIEGERRRTTVETERRAKVEYRKLLQKELEKVKLEEKYIKKIVNKIRETSLTPTQVYKMAKEELEKAIKDKQSVVMSKHGKAEDSSTRELMGEIRQLKSMVTKLKTTDVTYKTSLRKLQESNRKMTKQLKNQKSSNALQQATSTKNSFGEGASGK